MVQMLQIGQEMERAVTGSEKHSELREGTLSSIGREETGGGGGSSAQTRFQEDESLVSWKMPMRTLQV